MHILYLYQYFMTRSGYTGTRSYEFARHLVKNGHQVTMMCSGLHNEPRLTVPAGSTHFVTEIDGITCVPIASACANPLKVNRMGGARRMMQFMHFARLAKKVGRTLPKPDVIFATHVPLTIGIPAMDLGKHFDVPFVFEVRDVWPDALVNCGALKNPLVIHWMRRLAKKIYRASDSLIALSPGMKDGIVNAGVASDKVHVIPNASDLDLFHPSIDRTFGRERLGIGDNFAAIYFGAMGFANGLELVVAAAKILQNKGRSDITIVLHGDGSQRKRLEKMAAENNAKNIVFSDPLPDKEAVSQLVAACDVGLTIYRASKEHSWSPNKMFDTLAAGKPVVVNVPGWLSDTIVENQCGKSVDSEDPVQLANTLEELADSPEACRAMGENARELAEEKFARNKLAAQLEEILRSAAS